MYAILQHRCISDVHIRVQQRSSTKKITIVEGLAKDLDLQKIKKFFTKWAKTGGAVIPENEGLDEVIQVQGDKRWEFEQFLTKYHICQPSEIKVHGYVV